jgi:hypothetical protein
MTAAIHSVNRLSRAALPWIAARKGEVGIAKGVRLDRQGIVRQRQADWKRHVGDLGIGVGVGVGKWEAMMRRRVASAKGAT